MQRLSKVESVCADDVILGMCRDSQGCPGGFVTDSSVHHIAALRALGTAAGQLCACLLSHMHAYTHPPCNCQDSSAREHS